MKYLFAVEIRRKIMMCLHYYNCVFFSSNNSTVFFLEILETCQFYNQKIILFHDSIIINCKLVLITFLYACVIVGYTFKMLY